MVVLGVEVGSGVGVVVGVVVGVGAGAVEERGGYFNRPSQSFRRHRVCLDL